MELKDYICTEFEHLNRVSSRVLSSLTQFELMWRPGPGCNSIGLLLFHCARFEDSVIHSEILGKPLLWDTQKWHEKLNLPINESGAHYSMEQVAAFPVPDMKQLQAYYDAVRAETLECIKTLPLERFDQTVKLPFGEFTVGSLLALAVNHQAQHLGEMSYLRGMQRGMDK